LRTSTSALEGGWYFALRVSPRVFLNKVRSSLDASAVLLYYGDVDSGTGIAMLPGELFGYRFHGTRDDSFVLRGTLAVDYDQLYEFAARLRDMAFRLRAWPDIVGRATKAARAVADVDGILAQTTY
jgi:hypothetical protein